MENTGSTFSPESTLRSLEGTSQGFAHDVKGYSKEALASVSSSYDTAIGWAKKNPLQAAAIGAGAGFLIGTYVRKLLEKRA